MTEKKKSLGVVTQDSYLSGLTPMLLDHMLDTIFSFFFHPIPVPEEKL